MITMSSAAREIAAIIFCTSRGSMLSCQPRARSPSTPAMIRCSQLGESVAAVMTPSGPCILREISRDKASRARSVRKSTLRDALP